MSELQSVALPSDGAAKDSSKQEDQEQGSSPSGVLVLDKVSKSFGKFQAVRDVSIEVHKGEIFGFLGPNGAGKSTTIRMILDVLRPTAGEITMFGHSSREVAKVHRHIGFLSGDMVMDTNLTGQQYLDFVAGQYGQDCRPQIEQLSKLLQADLHVKIGNYSRGNRQKVGLIAALMHQPHLLILDEPTSGFDPLVQENFVKLIRRFRDSGRTVFMSSHILTEVQELCDRVAFIKDGQIIDTTTIGDLTAKASKRVSVQLPAGQTAKAFKRVSDLKGVRMGTMREDYGLTFAYDGSIKLLLQVLAQFDLKDVTIKEPDLEEIFMHYYEKDAKPAVAESTEVAETTGEAK